MCRAWLKNLILALITAPALSLGVARTAQADPSHYPQFAQQSLPDDVTLQFISVDELVEAVKAGDKPMILDVRTAEEFNEAHILSAQSTPLADFKDYLKSIPRERLVVLY